MYHFWEFSFLAPLWARIKILIRQVWMSKFGSHAQHGQWRMDFIGSFLPRLHAIGKGNSFPIRDWGALTKWKGSQSGKLKIPDVSTESHRGWGLPEPGSADETPTRQSMCIWISLPPPRALGVQPAFLSRMYIHGTPFNFRSYRRWCLFFLHLLVGIQAHFFQRRRRKIKTE